MAQATHYICQSCGTHYTKWIGRCENCQSWNSLVQEVSDLSRIKTSSSKKHPELILDRLDALNSETLSAERYRSGIDEFDRVTGGGLIPGSALLISGDPGIGKSTLLLQISAAYAAQNLKIAYISGEEALGQIRDRAERLKIKESTLELANETSLEVILKGLKAHRPDIIIIDSIQTLWTDTLPAAPGTVTQTRTSTHELIQLAKKHAMTVLFVGHVTKEGQIAGPRVIEHMVDTILFFEGDVFHQMRVLRSTKNRFGPTGEIGLFEMTSRGLASIENPSSVFLSANSANHIGSAVFAGLAGMRPLLTEIQALIVKTGFNTPRRAVVGWDPTRLSTILAVLQARCQLGFNEYDVYLNIAGGLKISDPAADLAVASALISAYYKISLTEKRVVFGELSLSGYLRPVMQTEMRIKEAMRLGFTSALLPENSKLGDMQLSPESFSLLNIKKLDEVIDLVNKRQDTQVKSC